MEGDGIESIVVVICGRFFTCRINEGRMIVQEIVKKKKKNREPVRFNINFIREKQCISCQVTVMSHKLELRNQDD